MTESTPGSGWWIASDGKWYPPESHPDRMTPPPPEGGWGPTPTGIDTPVSSGPATSEIAAPPAEPPPVPTTGDAAHSEPPRRWMSAAAAPVPDQPEPTPAPVSPEAVAAVAPGHTTPAAPWVAVPRPKMPVVVGAAVLVALAVAALVVALTVNNGGGSSTLTQGEQTAVLHITDSPEGHSTFSGTVGGQTLRGVVTNATGASGPSGTSGLLGSGTVLPLVTYTGTLGATAYILHVSIQDTASQLTGGRLAFTVNGTYGSDPVKATATFVLPQSAEASSDSAVVSGTVGRDLVTGTATARQEGQGAITVTARLNVLGLSGASPLP